MDYYCVKCGWRVGGGDDGRDAYVRHIKSHNPPVEEEPDEVEAQEHPDFVAVAEPEVSDFRKLWQKR